MRVRIHPVCGVAVREDGAICVRRCGSRKFYWFYGHVDTRGYCKVKVGGKYRQVGRVVLEAFAGMPKEGEQCDHNNRARNDNRISNLRWVSATENSRNTRGNDRAMSKYGCNWYADKNAYHRAWRKVHGDSRNKQEEATRCAVA